MFIDNKMSNTTKIQIDNKMSNTKKIELTCARYCD